MRLMVRVGGAPCDRMSSERVVETMYVYQPQHKKGGAISTC
jgi:hypothetical protein